MRAVIVGLGHPLHTDDAAGLECAEQLRQSPCSEHVEIISCTGTILEYLSLIEYSELVVLIDAVDAGLPSGSVIRRRLADGEGASLALIDGVDSHESNVSLCIRLLRHQRSTAPTILLYGIQPESTAAGEALTVKVSSAKQYLTSLLCRDWPWSESQQMANTDWVLCPTGEWKEVSNVHGFGWMQQALVEVDKAAREDGFSSVAALHIFVGEASGYPREELDLAFESLKPGTVCENARLVIETEPAILQCLRCDTRRPWTQSDPTCPSCGEAQILISGSEIKLLGVDTN